MDGIGSAGHVSEELCHSASSITYHLHLPFPARAVEAAMLAPVQSKGPFLTREESHAVRSIGKRDQQSIAKRRSLPCKATVVGAQT